MFCNAFETHFAFELFSYKKRHEKRPSLQMSLLDTFEVDEDVLFAMGSPRSDESARGEDGGRAATAAAA